MTGERRVLAALFVPGLVFRIPIVIVGLLVAGSIAMVGVASLFTTRRLGTPVVPAPITEA